MLYRILDRKFFIDDLYVWLVKGVALRLAAFLNWFDKTFVNGVMVNKTSYGILNIGKIGAKIQSGLLQDYISWTLAAGVLVIFWLIYSLPGGV